MKENYSEERKLIIENLNKNRVYSNDEREKFRKLAYEKYKNQPKLKERISQA
jgi:hypothetical protein